jgi:hypothetical protein
MSFNARNTDPSTSHSAADNDVVKRRDKAAVQNLFVQHDPRGIADFQLDQLMGGAMNGKWRKRRSDLTREGFLIKVGEIVNPATHKTQIVWGLKRKQQQPQVLQQSTFSFD